VACRAYGAANLWWLGYPEQALQWSHEAVMLARELAHPFSLGFALFLTSWVPQFRREGPLTHERAEAAIALAAEHGFAVFGAGGTIFRGWALAARSIEPGPEQEPREEGIAQIQQGLAAWRATGAEALRPY
jgi:predicted ATPase